MATIKSLGEIALRVNDLNSMQAFYIDVVGLSLMRRFPAAAFFRIAQGYGGHTQILAMFDRSSVPDDAGTYQRSASQVRQDESTLDHFAFAIDRSDYESEKRRLEKLGLTLECTTFPWVGWRSIFFHDPEGNIVELVCYDESCFEPDNPDE